VLSRPKLIGFSGNRRLAKRSGDFTAVAWAFGAHGERVTEPDDLAAAVRSLLAALDVGRPPCCTFTSRLFEISPFATPREGELHENAETLPDRKLSSG